MLDQPAEDHAPVAGVTAVPAERILIEILLEMLSFHAVLVRTKQPLFHQGEHTVDTSGVSSLNIVVENVGLVVTVFPPFAVSQMSFARCQPSCYLSTLEVTVVRGEWWVGLADGRTVGCGYLLAVGGAGIGKGCRCLALTGDRAGGARLVGGVAYLAVEPG